MFCATNAGLLHRSLNDSVWYRCGEPIGSIESQFVLNDSSDIYVLTVNSTVNQQLFLSRDMGQTWKNVPLPYKMFCGVEMTAYRNMIFVCNGNASDCLLEWKDIRSYYSTDVGNSWHIYDTSRWVKYSFDRFDPEAMYDKVVNSKPRYQYVSYRLPLDIDSILNLPRVMKHSFQNNFYSDYRGSLYRCKNLTGHWEQIELPGIKKISDTYGNGRSLVIVDEKDMVYSFCSRDSAEKQLIATSSFNLYQGKKHYWIVPYSGLLQSDSCGKNWDYVESSLHERFIRPFEVNDNELYFYSYTGNSIIRSTDGGDTWQNISINLTQIRDSH
jgi:hypothetical protein